MEWANNWLLPKKRTLAAVTAVVFFVLWCWGEAGRMNGALFNWSGVWPLLLVSLAIGLAASWPRLSMGSVAALLVLQFLGVIAPPAANHWAIYLGAFIALGFMLWTGNRRTRRSAAVANAVFIGLMTFLIVDRRFGAGVGWLQTTSFSGNDFKIMSFGLLDYAFGVCLLSLLAVAGLFAAVGLLLAVYESRRALSQEQAITQAALHSTETELVIQQERGRISRDLHDVLAHSLAVIAAQADGTRYASPDQPAEVRAALESIADSARRALIDAQLVIEGVAGETSQAPQPGLRELAELLEQSSSSNLKLHRSDSGVPGDLAVGQEVAVYRIVQEAMTNALKHGALDGEILVHFDWKDPGLLLQVSSRLSELAPAGNLGGGHRLPGMQERARLAGGWLSKQRHEAEGLFQLTAFIPYPAQQQSVPSNAAARAAA